MDDISSLSDLTLLTELNLWSSKISRGLEVLARLSSLVKLDVAMTGFNDSGAVYLSDLSNLTELDLSGSSVSDHGLRYLSGLSSLRKLFLRGTAVGSNGVRHLCTLKSLEVRSLRQEISWFAGFDDGWYGYTG